MNDLILFLCGAGCGGCAVTIYLSILEAWHNRNRTWDIPDEPERPLWSTYIDHNTITSFRPDDQDGDRLRRN